MLKGNLGCEEVSKLLLNYIEEKITDNKKRDRIALHLRNCPFCMEKYTIVNNLVNSIKEKNIQRAKDFRRFRLISAYCDNELTRQSRTRLENAVMMNKKTTQRIQDVNKLSRILNENFEFEFENLELNLEKGIMEKLKKQSIIDRVKNFFSPIP